MSRAGLSNKIRLREEMYSHDKTFDSLRDEQKNPNELIKNYKNIIKNSTRAKEYDIYQNLKSFQNSY